MRAAALVVVFALFAGHADATVAVVSPRNRVNTITGTIYSQGNYASWGNQTMSHAVGFLERHGARPGVDYFVYTPEQVAQTRQGANGGTYLAGQGYIQGRQHDAVIWVGVETQTLANNPVANCWPCSLSTVAMAPSVPQLFIGLGSGENFFNTAGSNACSLYVVSGGLDPGSQGPSFSRGVRIPVGSNLKSRALGWEVGTAATVPHYSGGFRYLLGIYESGANFDLDSLENVTYTADKYGLLSLDTAAVAWTVAAKLNTHKSGMAQLVLAKWGTAAITRMGGSDANLDQHLNGDPFPIYYSIAYLDSLTGRKVLPTVARPVRFAIQLDGLATRGVGTSGVGLSPRDTTVAYASLDSINGLGVPIAIGVNTDSADTYLRDIIVAKSVSRAKFTPYIRTGLDTSVAGNGRASYLKPIDLVGRYRNRVFVGPQGTAAGDTSLRNLAQWTRWRIDSIFGPGRFSGMLMAPEDDWSPKNATNQQPQEDSLVLALASAGFTGVAMNHEIDTLNTAGIANPRGVTTAPHFTSNILGDKRPFGFVAFTRLLNLGHNDPFAIPNQVGNYGMRVPFCLRKLWMSAYARYVTPPTHAALTRTGLRQDWGLPTVEIETVGKMAPTARVEYPVSILRVSFSELGGGSDDYGIVHRPGWYAIKSLVNQAAALNAVAGRNLVNIVYPDDLGPQDLR